MLSWIISDFARPINAEPIISASKQSSFVCPVRGDSCAWESLHTFNPTAVVRGNQVYLIYRAEDDSGEMRVGGHTSRLGLAVSDDGVHFTRFPKPILYPGMDDQKPFEWSGGCEDPRIAERADGLYVLTYTQYNGQSWRIGLATSSDLLTWKKVGSPFAGSAYEKTMIKSASIVHAKKNGRLIAAKINGKYWMYFGEQAVHVATSDDLVKWRPVEESPGKLLTVMTTRKGFFDSALTEVGPQLVQTKQGILLIYNGKNLDPKDGGDPNLSAGVYSCGQALFSNHDPTKLIERSDKPFFKPELAWEKTGQYAAGTTFAEGLVLFKGHWFLYYGCADTFVGAAIAKAK